MRADLLRCLAAGCAAAPGRPVSPARLAREPGWLATRPIPLTLQVGEMDCGPAAASMLLAFWGRGEPPAALRAEAGVPEDRGLTAVTLRDLIRARGLGAHLLSGEIADLERELAAGRPALVGTLRKGPGGLIAHSQLVAALHRQRGLVVVADPAVGWRELTLEAFQTLWSRAHRVLIVAFPRPEPGQAQLVSARGR
jgi:ABC-type bacteriocin/lantibiotic exporter with double-glycine peptidase domain